MPGAFNTPIPNTCEVGLADKTPSRRSICAGAGGSFCPSRNNVDIGDFTGRIGEVRGRRLLDVIGSQGFAQNTLEILFE